MKNSILKCTTLDEVYEMTKHKNWWVRLQAYRAAGFTEKAFDDEDPYIRLQAYRTLGFTEKAFDDEDPYIRLHAYKTLGFTEKALEDEDSCIRLEAYQTLVFTEKALSHIKLEAKNYLHVQKLKERESHER